MARAPENPFERLPDDLVQNILERRLWRLFDFSTKRAKERVQLEAACKRFQSLVWTLGSFEWDYPSGPKSEAAFTRYMLAREDSTIPLTRFALHLDDDMSLSSFVLSVSSQCRGTLREVHLLIDDRDTLCMNWELILSFLQTCSKLEVLNIQLRSWMPTEIPDATVSFEIPPHTFSSLQSLCLLGSSIDGDLQSFIQSLPSLRNLELHHKVGETTAVKSSSLRKVFWWGNTSARMDLDDPAGVNVPGSLGMLLSTLVTGDGEMQSSMLPKLDYLVNTDVANQKVMATVPGVVQQLVIFFDFSGEAEYYHWVLNILAKLSYHIEAQKVLGGVPENIERLLFILNFEEKWECDDVVAIFLNLSAQVEYRKAMTSIPGWVQSLVRLVIKKREEWADTKVPQQILETLSNLAGECETAKSAANDLTSLQRVLEQVRVAEIPGLWEGIVDLLDLKKRAVQTVAVDLLEFLVKRSDVRAVAVIPGCIEKLVRLLGDLLGFDASTRLQGRAARILQDLTTAEETAKAVALVPECLGRLVQLLNCGRARNREVAAWVLFNIARNPEGCKAVAGVPGVVQLLAGLLHSTAQEAAAAVLGRLSSQGKCRRAMVAAPMCLRLLSSLLDCGGAGVRKHAAFVFYGLAGDATLRELLRALPGLLVRLAWLLISGGQDEQTLCAAAGAVGRLARDTVVASRLARLPECVYGLVELLGPSVSMDVQVAAVQALRNLSIHPEAREAVAGVPGALRQLEFLSKVGSASTVRIAAAAVLRNLGTFEVNRLAIIVYSGAAGAIVGATGVHDAPERSGEAGQKRPPSREESYARKKPR